MGAAEAKGEIKMLTLIRSGETDHRALAEGDGKRDASNIILEILQFYLQFAGCGGGDDIWKHNLRSIDKNF